MTSPTPAPTRLLLASAGTGKTFALARHFLTRLAAGVPPERILATTFTRKAAGEILARVLGTLADGACCTDPAELPHELLGPDARPFLDAEGCAKLLGRLLPHLDRFQVHTLDAFFFQRLRLIGLELGLPPGWSIADEQDDVELRARVLERLLADGDRQERLTILRALHKRAAEGILLDATLQLLNTATQLHEDRPENGTSPEAAPSPWEALEAPEPTPAEIVEEWIEELESTPVPTNQAQKPDKRWLNARNKVCASARDGDWGSLLKGTLVLGAWDGVTTYYGRVVPAHLAAALRPLIEEARDRLRASLVRRNRALGRLLDEYAPALHRARLAARAFCFHDLPRLLGRAREHDERLAYRHGLGIHELLLDEFQDTSITQWRALEPLLTRVIAECARHDGKASFFCVGDAKQSIYAWREGEPRLLLGLPERYPVLRAEELAKSYRCAPAILRFVNDFFQRIGENPALADENREDFREAAAAFAEAFPTQVSARPEGGDAEPGSVRMEEIPVESKEKGVRLGALARGIAERAQAVHARRPGDSIGILLRTRSLMPRVLYELKSLGVPATVAGGSPPTDSAAVLETLSLFQFADHPHDSAARWHLAHGRLSRYLRSRRQPLPPESGARALRERLLREGYGAFLTALLSELEPLSAWDRARYEQLIELGFQWDARATLRPTDFVRFVRGQRVESPGYAAVQVMTVHGAKGLEFDTVILGDLDGKIIHGPPPFVWRRTGISGPLELATLYPTGKLPDFDPELAALRRAHRQRSFEEQLCVLYVAMTRARNHLEILLLPPRRGDLSLAHLLRAGDLLPDSETKMPEQGDLVPNRHPIPRDAPGTSQPVRGAETESDAAPDEVGPLLAPSRKPRSLPRETPSGLERQEGPRVRDLLGGRIGATARRRGSLLHRWLQEIEWIEDFHATDEELLSLATAEGFPPPLARELLPEFRRVLAGPELRAALARPAAADTENCEVWRERRFTLILSRPDDGPRLLQGSFDRVLLEGPSGAWQRATILDFKSDRLNDDPARLAAAVERYRPQLDAYREALATITRLAPERIHTRLLFLAEDRLVDPAPGMPRLDPAC